MAGAFALLVLVAPAAHRTRHVAVRWYSPPLSTALLWVGIDGIDAVNPFVQMVLQYYSLAFLLVWWAVIGVLWGIEKRTSLKPERIRSVDKLKNQLKMIAEGIDRMPVNSTEEACKQALVMPFIMGLGYEIFNPAEVLPEYAADFGTKKGEKVDYAILRDGQPLFLFECKRLDDPLDVDKISQLSRYFQNTPAEVGILTNGAQYKFFSDLEEKNVMDRVPFFEVDLRSPAPEAIEMVGKFSKDLYSDTLKTSMYNMKYVGGIKSYLTHMSKHPDDEFVKMLAKHVYKGPIIKKRLEEFRSIVQAAFMGLMSDHTHKILERVEALRSEGLGNSKGEPAAVEAQAEEPTDRGIDTTADEVEAFEMVQEIVEGVVPPDRVVIKDTRSYCGVLLDNNVRRPICRFYFGRDKYQLRLINEDKTETKVDLATIEDLAQHAEALQATVRRYIGSDPGAEE